MNKMIYLFFLCLVGGCGSASPAYPVVNEVHRVSNIVEGNDLVQWVIVLGLIGCGVSVMLLMIGNAKVGLAGFCSCLTVIAMGVILTEYQTLFLWVGGIVSFLLTITVCYKIWVHSKAVTELVASVSIAGSHDNWSDAKPMLSKVQTGTTKQLVKGVKTKLKVMDYLEQA